MNGLYEHESASCRVTYSQMVPPHLRGRCREISALSSKVRGQGHGSALMRKVCDSADSGRLALLLVVDGESSVTDLVAWYRRFGFEPIQEEPCVMVRMPAHG